MDKSLALIVLRFLTNFALQTGKPKQAAAFKLLADMIESGKKVDAHMAALAANLANDQYDWDGAVARIQANSKW